MLSLLGQWKYKCSCIRIRTTIIRVWDTSKTSKHLIVLWFYEMQSGNFTFKFLMEYCSSKSISSSSKQQLYLKAFLIKPFFEQLFLRLSNLHNLNCFLIKTNCSTLKFCPFEIQPIFLLLIFQKRLNNY